MFEYKWEKERTLQCELWIESQRGIHRKNEISRESTTKGSSSAKESYAEIRIVQVLCERKMKTFLWSQVCNFSPLKYCPTVLVNLLNGTSQKVNEREELMTENAISLAILRIMWCSLDLSLPLPRLGCERKFTYSQDSWIMYVQKLNNLDIHLVHSGTIFSLRHSFSPPHWNGVTFILF